MAKKSATYPTSWEIAGGTDKNAADLARFMAKVDKSSAAPCWLWAGATTVSGVGRFWYEGQAVAAHEWLYRQAWPIPAGTSLIPLCGLAGCVNPAHREPSVKITRFGIAAKNARKRECPKGHPYTEQNTYRFGPKKQWRACRECRRQRTTSPSSRAARVR